MTNDLKNKIKFRKMVDVRQITLQLTLTIDYQIQGIFGKSQQCLELSIKYKFHSLVCRIDRTLQTQINR